MFPSRHTIKDIDIEPDGRGDLRHLKEYYHHYTKPDGIETKRQYNRKYFVGLAKSMVRKIDPAGFEKYTEPGIRAQLLDKEQLMLVQDFVIEGDEHSTHILNAISPAFTCAFPFAEFVTSNHILRT